VITHDLLDVLTLADRVLVLEAGRIVESGSATTVLATPRSRFGARFAGVNLVDGTAGADGVLTTEWGTVWHGSPAQDVLAGQSAVAPVAPAPGRRVRRQAARQPPQHRRGDGRRTRQPRSRDPGACRRAARRRTGTCRRHHRRIRRRVAAGTRRSRLLLREGSGGH